MEIVHIFSPKNDPYEGLWAVKYEEAEVNEFENIFEVWQDPEIMYQFCIDNLEDIRTKFGYRISPETAANELMEEAEDLQQLIYKLGKKQMPGTNLQLVFKPLHNYETNLTVLQLSKGIVKNRSIKNPKLRIYAVRVAENTYIVTGGAIKLTDLMDDRPHTKEQRLRLMTVKDWLKREGISYPEDLNNLL
ncbi:MAG TPA: hypothetical protein VF939_25820 [Puia sp.]